MDSLVISFNAIAPLFLIIAVGYFAKRWGFVNEQEAKRFNAVLFYTLMPAMMFHSIYTSDFDGVLRPGFALFTCAMVLAMYAASVLVVLAVEKERPKRGVMIQAAYRSNFVLLGLPVASALAPEGDIGTTALMVAIVVPLFNVLAVGTLEFFRGRTVRPRQVAMGIVKNPLILGSACGLLVRALGLELPVFLESFVSKLSGAATPMVLLLLGSSFDLRRVRAEGRELLLCVGLRLIVFPGLILGAAALRGIRGIEFITLLILFAAPTAVNSFNMAQQMGGDQDLAAGAVMASTALSCFTLFLWVGLFRYLGMF